MRAFFGGIMRTIAWNVKDESVDMIDQRRLPGDLVYHKCHTAEGMVYAIEEMVIRGAPALGVAGAFGVALGARQLAIANPSNWQEELQRIAQSIFFSRPTAVNLAWGVERVMRKVSAAPDAITAATIAFDEAQLMADEDVQINYRLAQNGATLIKDGDVLIHHCNTGSLAGVDWGTALGAIRYAHESSKRVKVLVDETRPRLQGARLTAWECEQYGIPYQIITDNAAGYFLQRKEVNAVFFGADRVAANGDVVNKIGTYMLSLAAKASDVPVYCVFPKSTVDTTVANGMEVCIEERDPQEVLALSFLGERTSPASAQARNPAFDITPASLISAWITEDGIIIPPFKGGFSQSVYNSK